MPRELRSRKVVETINDGETVAKVVEKTTVKSKRKAVEDGSPVALKQQKATKIAKTKKAAKDEPKLLPEAEPVVEAEATMEVEEDASESDSEAEDNVQALALQVDPEEEDTRADEAEAEFMTGGDVGKIPKHARKAAYKSSGEPGVVYVGRVPHGFYEHEMKQYFCQFGPINKLRLSRNKKTGASKHFAFIEFAEATTADIVAKTMDSYLLFGHILKVRTIPKEKVHEDLFKGSNKRFKKIPWNKMAGLHLEKPLSESTWEKKVTTEQSKRAKQAAKLKAIGYEFEAPSLKAVPPPVAAPAIEEAEEVKVIEEAPVAEETVVKVTETVTETPTTEEVEVEITSISAPKPKATKAKGKAAKGRKAKQVEA